MPNQEVKEESVMPRDPEMPEVVMEDAGEEEEGVDGEIDEEIPMQEVKAGVDKGGGSTSRNSSGRDVGDESPRKSKSGGSDRRRRHHHHHHHHGTSGASGRSSSRDHHSKRRRSGGHSGEDGETAEDSGRTRRRSDSTGGDDHVPSSGKRSRDRRGSRSQKSHRRSDSGRDEGQQQFESSEDPLLSPPSRRAEREKKAEAEAEDGEILEDGELDDDDDGNNDVTPATHHEESDNARLDTRLDTSFEDMEGSGSKSHNNSKEDGKSQRKDRKRQDHRDKRKREDDKKKRKKYVDVDKAPEDDSEAGPAWGSGYQGRPPKGGSPQRLASHSPPHGKPPKTSPGGRVKGYQSPPGLYDSPSYSEDSEDDQYLPSLGLLSGGYLDASVAADEKEGIFKRNVTFKKKKRSDRGQQGMGKRRGQDFGKGEGPPKKKALIDIAMSDRPKCKFYRDGKCAKGSGCQFNHDMEQPKRMEVCKYHLTVKGCHKERCLYMHDFPCKYYHTGAQCFSGDRCKFSHDTLTPETRRALEMRVAPEDILDMDDPDYDSDYDYRERNYESRGRPSLLGSPPRRHDVKKIPSLFDIEVHPPAPSPKPSPSSIRPTGFYNEAGSSPPSSGETPGNARGAAMPNNMGSGNPANNNNNSSNNNINNNNTNTMGNMATSGMGQGGGPNKPQGGAGPGLMRPNLGNAMPGSGLLQTPNMPLGGGGGPLGPMMGSGPMAGNRPPLMGNQPIRPGMAMMNNNNNNNNNGGNNNNNNGGNPSGNNLPPVLNMLGAIIREAAMQKVSSSINMNNMGGMNMGPGNMNNMPPNNMPPNSMPNVQNMNSNMPPNNMPNVQNMNNTMPPNSMSNAQNMNSSMPPNSMSNAQNMNSSMPPNSMSNAQNMNSNMPPNSMSNVQNSMNMPPNSMPNVSRMSNMPPNSMSNAVQNNMNNAMNMAQGNPNAMNNMGPNNMNRMMQGMNQMGPGPNGNMGLPGPNARGLMNQGGANSNFPPGRADDDNAMMPGDSATASSGDSWQPQGDMMDVDYRIKPTFEDGDESSKDLSELDSLRRQLQEQIKQEEGEDEGEEDEEDAEGTLAEDQAKLGEDQPSGDVGGLSPDQKETAEDSFKKDVSKSTVDTSLESIEVPSHLPKKQRELFMRIQQQQILREERERQEALKASEEPEANVEENDWYSSSDEDEEDKAKKAKSKDKDSPEAKPVANDSVPVTTAEADKPSSTFNIMQMINAIRKQVPPTAEAKSSGPSINTSDAPDPRKRAHSVEMKSPASPPTSPVQQSPTPPAFPAPVFGVEPPVISAMPTKPLKYAIVKIALNMAKTYTFLPASMDAMDPRYRSDPRVKRHFQLVDKHPQSPVSTPRDKDLRRSSVDGSAAPDKSAKLVDPRLNRTPTDPRLAKMGGGSPISGRPDEGRPSDPRLKKDTAPARPVDPRLAKRAVTAVNDPRLNRQMSQESGNQGMGGPMNNMPPSAGGGNFMGNMQPRMGGPMGNMMGGPMNNISGPMNNMGGPMNNPGGPMNNMGGPINNMGGPMNNMGGPRNNMGGPMNSNMGGPMNNNMGGPMNSNMGGPMNNNMGGPMNNNMGGPMNNMGGPMNNMGGPMNNMGGLGTNQMGGPMNNMNGPIRPMQGGGPMNAMNRMGGPMNSGGISMNSPMNNFGGPINSMGSNRMANPGGGNNAQVGIMGPQGPSLLGGPINRMAGPGGMPGPMANQAAGPNERTQPNFPENPSDPRRSQRPMSDPRLNDPRLNDLRMQNKSQEAQDHSVNRNDPRLMSGSQTGKPTKSGDSSLDPRLANDPRRASDFGDSSMPRGFSSPKMADSSQERDPLLSKLTKGIMEPLPSLTSSASLPPLPSLSPPSSFSSAITSSSSFTDTQSTLKPSSPETTKPTKKFDYRNDPRFKRVKRAGAARQSSMEYSSPLGGDGDAQNTGDPTGSLQYNSYNRPKPTGPSSPHPPNAPSPTLPDTLQDFDTPDLPPPADLKVKDVFKAIDPTASPFC